MEQSFNGQRDCSKLSKAVTETSEVQRVPEPLWIEAAVTLDDAITRVCKVLLTIFW